MISIRAASRGWGHNLAPRFGTTTTLEPVADSHEPPAAPPGPDAPAEPDAQSEFDAPSNPSSETITGASADAGGDGSPTDRGEPVDARRSPWPVHPLGIVAAAVLVLAVLYSTVLDTNYLIGNLEPWQWLALLVVVALSLWPAGLNGLRVGIESIASVTKRISMFLAWFVFIVQLFNVITRYGTRYVDQDILIGQATSLAWMSFAALFLLGANYGIRDGVNPRIDFWWANFSERRKATIDFLLHTFLFLPFLFMAIRILQPYAAIALGRKRDGSWPSGYRVWETWEQSSDADQLPVGPIKALLLIGFVLMAVQIVAELIKTGFVIAGRRKYADVKDTDAPQRIE